MKNDSFKTSTGIQIGIMYVNRTSLRPLDDPDMLLLQEALVRTGASKMDLKSTKYMQRAALFSCVLLILMFVASMYLDPRYLA
jgi:hypothetical protein